MTATKKSKYLRPLFSNLLNSGRVSRSLVSCFVQIESATFRSILSWKNEITQVRTK